MILDEVRPVCRMDALTLIQRCHYSKVMPRLSRYYIGGLSGGRVVAVCTLGWGVRPVHTIKGMFPSLGTADYLEIGKLCVDDECPTNTESWFLARVSRWVRHNAPDVKLLFSWADGIIGKAGYVYQAANYYYGGYIISEMYLDSNGVRVHPRTVQGITRTTTGVRGPRDKATTERLGLTKYWGKQFRYVYPLCSKWQWKALQAESPYNWTRGNYPKDADCTWQVSMPGGGREACGIPPFIQGTYAKRWLRPDRAAQGVLLEAG